MPYDLRPLTLAELLDRAFGLYRRHFWLFVGIMAFPSLAMLVLSVGQQYFVAAQDVPADQRPTLTAAVVVPLVLVLVLAFLVYWISYVVALGATTFAVSGIYADRTPA